MPTITTLTSTSGSYRLLPNTSDLVLAFDIETNGLLYSKEAPVSAIWCIVIFDCKEKRYYEYRPHEIEDAYAHLSKATILIGHNIISYDIPVLQVLKPGWTTKAQFIDTFTLASLVYPKDKLLELDTSIFDHIDKKLRGRQSLRAWGQRLQNLKGDHEDWTQFSEEMLSYCKNDVLVTIQLYTYLVNSLKSQDPELKNLKSIAIEHDLSQILMLQMHTGWTFDVDSALDLDEKLRTRLNQLTEELDRTIPATVERTVIVPKRDNKTKGYIKGIPFTKEKTVPFNPGSRQQILQFFKEKYDWQPKEKTEKGNFKVNDDILEELSYPEAKLLAEYFLLQKRLGQLSDGNKSWLGLVDHNNVIHGSIVSSGCVTGRSIHRDPNLGQVPNAGAPYGPECRSLFRPTPGFMLMGSDAKALELRCLGGYLAHYDNGDYASKVIDPDVDIHTYNQEKFGVETRDISKRLIYCVPVDITQVLTKEGWKFYNELSVGQLVMTYNQEKNIKEWKPILHIVEAYEDDVWQMSHNHSFSVQSTCDHRWFVRKRTQSLHTKSKWKTGKRYMVPKIETTNEINQESNIIVNAFYLEEDNQKDIYIDWAWPKYGTDWVKIILKMNSSQRRAWLSGFMLADGFYRCKPNQKSSWVISQVQNELYEAVLTAAYIEFNGHLHVGSKLNPSGKNQMVISVSNKSHVTGQRLVKNFVGKKKVFCISTENESFVMRQGECITITGNCVLYGGGPTKTGSIIAPTESTEYQKQIGIKTLDNFYKEIPALKHLKDDVETAINSRGYLRGLDGRELYVRSAYKGLNLLLQSAGAIIMKRVGIEIYEGLTNAGFIYGVDWTQNAYVHDEYQNSVLPHLVDTAKDIIINAYPKAGKFLDFKCPIEGDVKVGTNWYETH